MVYISVRKIRRLTNGNVEVYARTRNRYVVRGIGNYYKAAIEAAYVNATQLESLLIN